MQKKIIKKNKLTLHNNLKLALLDSYLHQFRVIKIMCYFEGTK